MAGIEPTTTRLEGEVTDKLAPFGRLRHPKNRRSAAELHGQPRRPAYAFMWQRRKQDIRLWDDFFKTEAERLI